MSCLFSFFFDSIYDGMIINGGLSIMPTEMQDASKPKAAEDNIPVVGEIMTTIKKKQRTLKNK